MKTFIEKLDIKFDIHQLKNQTNEILRKYPPVDHIFHSQGWGIISSSTDYKSSFQHYVPFRNGPGDRAPSKEEGLKQNAKNFIQDDSVPTELCTGYILEVIKQINDLGFNVRRCRMNLLKPLCATTFHKDITTEDYAACLHIPIITNPFVRFESQTESHYLPADGSAYLADISQTHRYVNNSLYGRVHLLMAIWDTKQVTKHFKWPYSIDSKSLFEK